jgi:hypothetical protein
LSEAALSSKVEATPDRLAFCRWSQHKHPNDLSIGPAKFDHSQDADGFDLDRDGIALRGAWS